MNPYPNMDNDTLILSAKNHIKAQKDLATRASEDSTHWHHLGIAWCMQELVKRLQANESS